MAHTPQQPLAAWRPPGLEAVPWLGALVTTRHGGTSPPPYDSLNLGLATGDDPARVDANRARLRTAFGLGDAPIVKLSQVHGTRVWRVPSGDAQEGDGLWTTDPEVVLAVGVADCVPVFLWDVSGRRVALVHAGWRGTAAAILREAVEILLDAGSRPADLRIALGPSIGPCCYTVGAEVASHFPPQALHRRDGVIHLDLRRANRMQAEACGIAPAHVAASPPCTACHPETYFSHRRDGARSGRMWALAWIRESSGAGPAESSGAASVA